MNLMLAKQNDTHQNGVPTKELAGDRADAEPKSAR